MGMTDVQTFARVAQQLRQTSRVPYVDSNRSGLKRDFSEPECGSFSDNGTFAR